jgi:hypothetical protein
MMNPASSGVCCFYVLKFFVSSNPFFTTNYIEKNILKPVIGILREFFPEKDVRHSLQTGRASCRPLCCTTKKFL